MRPKQEYTGKDIEILEGLEHVRERPGMYMGSTGKQGILQMLYEVLDNAVDEAVAGFCDEIEVRFHADGSYSVRDNGRGIPVDIHPEKGVPAVEVVMTTLFSGGKFSSKAYTTSSGLHGVGVAATNALSEYLEVEVARDGKLHRQRFEKGQPVGSLEVVGETDSTGTKVRFKPDFSIMEEEQLKPEELLPRLKELAFLNPGLKIRCVDEKTGREWEFHDERGVLGLVEEIAGDGALHPPFHTSFGGIITEKDKDKNYFFEVSFTYTNSKSKILSYVNNVSTDEGGTHVDGFRIALTKAIKRYGEERNLIPRDVDIFSEDVREDLVVVVNLRMSDPQFEGQTKRKLGNPGVRSVVADRLYGELDLFFQQNPRIAETIVLKVVSSAQARIAAKLERERVKRKSALKSASLPGKLVDCISSDPSETELFVVEGDSAGGNAKAARNRRFQAILPLRGKILNVEKAGELKMLENKEIQNLITSIGTGVGEDFDYSKLRYGKIIIMTDADVDGAHIRTLLLTFFFRYLKPLIERGHVYIAAPPLYRLRVGKESKYLSDDAEREEEERRLKREGKKYVLQRFKGLGEMNPDELWETTMDPETRKLYRVKIEDEDRLEELVESLMGKDVEPRRRFIIEHALEVENLDV